VHDGVTDKPLVAMVPARLAVSTRFVSLPAAVDDPPHRHVRDQAMAWQTMSGYAVFWEMMASAAGDDVAYALAGQMGAAGEQLALSYAAAVEVALWRDVDAEGDEGIGREMCMRAMAETESMFVMGSAHALANLAVRALSLSTDLKVKLARELHHRRPADAFDPFSVSPRDWRSMSAPLCAALDAAVKTSEVAIQDLVAPVVRFGLGTNWGAFKGQRDRDFHRWRPQTYGLQGVPQRSQWQDNGASRVLALGHPVDADAKGLGETVARIASSAMLELASTMEEFMDAWHDASPVLGGPSYRR
jgi:hypothetical protein